MHNHPGAGNCVYAVFQLLSVILQRSGHHRMDSEQDEDYRRRYSRTKVKHVLKDIGCTQVRFFLKLIHYILSHDLSHFIPLPVFVPEAQALATMLVAYGYIYPLQNHKKLVMCNDANLYRFQVKWNSPLFSDVYIQGLCCTLTSHC